MRAYLELRDRLAELYKTEAEWRSVAAASGADVRYIVFQGNSAGVWSNILNALRTQGHLNDLIEYLGRYDPDVVPVALAYSAELSNGEGAVVDLPQLRAVAVADSDLNADLVADSLDFAQTLPTGLLQMALADKQPTLDVVDATLQGTHTRMAKQKLEQFRHEFAAQLAKLCNLHRAAEAELVKTTAKVDRIESTRPPVEPVMQIPLNASDELRRLLLRQYESQITVYRAALLALEEERSSIVTLRARANSLKEESAQFASAIASLKIQKELSERTFERDVIDARDRDLLFAFGQILDKVSVAFQTEKKLFKAFWTLLGACAILQLLARIVASPSSAIEVNRRFSAQAERLAQALEDGVADIARPSLAGPLAVRRALAANRQSIADLHGRLSVLPLPALEIRFQRARALIDQPVLPLPDFSILEKPDELDKAASNLAGMQAVAQASIAEIQREIACEPPNLRSAVDLAEADAAATLRSVEAIATENAEALRRTQMFWMLLSRLSGSEQLPESLRVLCSALAQDFERRAGVTTDALLTDAVASKVGAKEASTFVAGHPLTGYITSTHQLAERLAEAEMHLAAVIKAGNEIEVLSILVEQRYRMRLYAVVLLTLVPVVGVVAAMFACHLVARLRPLVASDKPAYVRLGSFAVTALAWTAGLSGLAAAANAILATRNGIDFAEQSFVNEGIALAAAAFATFAISLCNLLKAMAYRREPKRRASKIAR